MSVTPKYDAVHTRKYTNKDGEEKKAYTNIGTVFEREDGSLCMKMLDSWVNFYPIKMKEEGYKAAKQAVQNDGFEDSQIPF